MTAPTASTVQDMSIMDPAVLQQLLLCGSRDTVSVQVQVVGPDLQVRRDLTARLQSGGSVEWQGESRVHRTCRLTLALTGTDEVSWQTELLRVSMTIRDGVTGVAGSTAVGTFLCARPERSLGTAIEDPTLGTLVAYDVQGQDVTCLLDRGFGYSYVATADGTAKVLDLAQTVITTAAGFADGTYLIDRSGQSTALAQTMTWPWFSPDSSDDADAGAGVTQPKDVSSDADSGPATFRTVINDLVGQVVYRAVWADAAGRLRLVPFVDAAVAAPTFTFDAVTAASSIVPDRSTARDLATFNAATYVWQNITPDGTVPTYGNGGLIDKRDDADIAARGGAPRGFDPTLVQLTAATAAGFAAAAAADFQQMRRAVVSVKASTIPYPLAGHFDVFTLQDSPLLGASSSKVQAKSWSLPLDGSPMSWEWSVIG